MFRGNRVKTIAELELLEKRKLLDNISDYLFEYIAEGNIFKLSEDFYNNLGYKPTQINTIRSFYETFMKDIVDTNTYKILTAKGEAKYLEINVVKGFLPLRESDVYYGFINDITERKLYEEKLYEYAYKDRLTGISNRRQLINELEDAMMEVEHLNKTGALIFFDLDGFKSVNDQFGHKYGDELLIEVSKRIRNILPVNTSFGRLGGDEFAIVIPNAMEVDIADFCEMMCLSVANDYVINDEKVNVTASVGVSYFPDDSVEINELVDYADQAMYVSKGKGKNCYSFWDSKTNATFE